MRIVLDTNVLIAAFIAHGACNELLEHCVVYHDVLLSKPILEEFRDVLVRKFGFSASEARAAERLLRSRAHLVKPGCLSRPVCRDCKDDMVLATALAGTADLIVTGDKDLTSLKSFHGIEILEPTQFWPFEGGRANRPES